MKKFGLRNSSSKILYSFLVLIYLLFCAVFPVHSDNQAILIDADEFYYQNYDNAIAASESKNFDISYAILKVPIEEQTEATAWSFEYVLVLTNISNKAIKNLKFNTHFNENMQIVLLNDSWQADAFFALNPLESNITPYRTIFIWSPLLLVDLIRNLPSFDLHDISDMLIKLEWDGGSEIVKLDYETMLSNFPDNIDKSRIFDEDEFELLIKASEKYKH